MHEVFVRSQMAAPRCELLPFGEVAVFSCSSPDKETGNEDSAAVLEFGEHMAVLVVADGLGGSRAGAAASEIAVKTLRECVDRAAGELTSPRTAVLNGVDLANHRILDSQPGSGTTVVVATVARNFLRVYHVGDSGLLQIGQRGRIKLQTIAHSPVGMAEASGMLSEEEALHHANRHIVANALGMAEMTVEFGQPQQLGRYDTVVLASDGLLDNLRTDEIAERVRKGPLNQAADALLATATHRMHNTSLHQPSKPDDLTFILFRQNAAPAIK